MITKKRRALTRRSSFVMGMKGEPVYQNPKASNIYRMVSEKGFDHVGVAQFLQPFARKKF